jgi:transcription elongation factor SPT5
MSDSEDEIYDEEEEEEEDLSPRESKRRRTEHHGGSQFVALEAEEDDDEGGDFEEEDTDEMSDFIDSSGHRGSMREAEMASAMANLPPVRHRHKSQEYLQKLEKKYANADDNRTIGVNDDDEDFDDEDLDDLESVGISSTRLGGPMSNRNRQQQQYPTIEDPKLFLVKCKQGKERQAVLTIMQKAFNLESQPSKRLQITSALCVEGFKGHIYVEAFKEGHVKAAVEGLHGLVYETGIKLIPLAEMKDVLNVGRKQPTLKKGDWVRVKRGVYKGDIAEVADVEEAQAFATIKLIPRIDFNNPDADKEKVPPGKTPINRPPQRLFNDKDEGIKDEVTQTKDPRFPHIKFSLYDNKKFYEGYLYKRVNFKGLEIKNVIPTLEELQKFNVGKGDDARATLENLNAANISSLAAGLKKPVQFKKGELVKVTEGDLKYLMGVVHFYNPDSGMVTILPKHESLTDALQIPASQLQKHFDVGTFVRVIGGDYDGETGYIVRIMDETDGTVILYNDVKKKEMKAFVSEIQETSEATATETSVGNYSLHDMVKIDASTMGVITKVEKEIFHVLDNNGSVKTLSLQEIGPKRNTSEGYKIPEKNSQLVGVNDTIRVIDGQYKGREAVVKQIYRVFLFCHARDLLENGGIFVVRAKQCELRGVIKDGAMRPPSAQQGKKTLGFIYRKRTNHPMLNKTVRITKGPYKGYLGIIKDVTDTQARVELHSHMKTISVDMSNLKEINSYTESSNSNRTTSGVRQSYQQSSRQSSDWDSRGGRTPLREIGSETPLRAPGSETPYPETPRTPSANDPWNPRQPTTPSARESMYMDSDHPQTSTYQPVTTPGAPSMMPFTPMTGHDHTVQTPAAYTPFTPGGAITPGPNYSYPTQTPGPYHPPETPFSHPPTTPGGAYAPTTPGGAYAPTTPGGAYAPTTPGGPYVPTTPGGAYPTPINQYHPRSAMGGRNVVNTPMTSINTPGGDSSYSAQTPRTPGMIHQGGPQTPITPGGAFMPPTTPGMHTHGMGMPMTPGAMYATPYAGGSHTGISQMMGGQQSTTEISSNWVRAGLVVMIADDSSYNGYRGVVRSVGTSGKAQIVLENEQQDEEDIIVDVDISRLNTAVPEKGAKVMVVKGEYRGMIGQMVSAEDTEKIAVVRMTDGQHKVLAWDTITPMATTSA